jgi:alanine dehydrogenase
VTLWLTNDEVQQLLTIDDCLDVLDTAYYEHGAGRAVNPPLVNLVTPDDTSPADPSDAMEKYHWLRSMPGGVQKLGVAAIRVNSYRVGYRETAGMKNKVRLPTAPGNQYTGVLMVFSIYTGEPLLMCPDGFLQRLRVGATAGLGVKYLAREDSATVGLLGSGFQAETHLMAACAVRPIKRIKLYSRDAERRSAFAKRMEKALGVETIAVAAPQEAVAGSDIVMTTTNSLKPVLKGEWLEDGMHVGTVLDLEVDVPALKRFDLIVSSRRGMLWQDHTMGDPENDRPPEGNPHNLPHYNQSKEQRGRPEIPVDWAKVPTLGELMVGKAKGRSNRSQVTYFINIGDGIQFAAVGAKLLEIAKAKKVGRELPFDLFHSQVNDWATLT